MFVALVLLILGLMVNSSNGWDALVYLLFSAFETIGFVATFISSFLALFMKRPEKV
jgi:hypothetical protein